MGDFVSKRAARLSIGAFFFLAGVCFASWASRIADIKQYMHLSDGGLGAVLFALPVGLLISLPFSGWLVTHYGSRQMVIPAALFYACLLPLLGLAATPWQLATVLFFFGLVGNLLNISMNTQAVSLEALYGRSIIASFHGIWSLAGFTGGAVGMLMVYLQMTPLQHFSTISGAVIVLTFFCFRNLLKKDINADTKPPLFAKPDVMLLKLGLIALCCMICEGTMFEWSTVYFRKIVQVPKELTILGYTSFMFTIDSTGAKRINHTWVYLFYVYHGRRPFYRRLAGHASWYQAYVAMERADHRLGTFTGYLISLYRSCHRRIFAGRHWRIVCCSFSVW
jgi:MFS family permease